MLCDRPVGLLTICVAIVLVSSLKIWISERSRYGDRLLNSSIDNSEHLRQIEGNSSQLLLAFALFGAKVLASDSALSNLHRLLASSDYGCGGCGD
ncbi:MAG: hypothetical protein QNJ72_13630 [Pleurocapsa sp. MO_226.B13]|nr:hypothetical protein [Pleurocapsa sp. MO_226.B13]